MDKLFKPLLSSLLPKDIHDYLFAPLLLSSPPLPSPNPFFSPTRPSSPKKPTFFFFFFFFFPTCTLHPINSIRARAVGEWREYEDAVLEKDLARALRFLKSTETLPPLQSETPPSSPVRYTDVFGPPERDWELLDTCLNADDMRLVGSSYAFLRERGLLQRFGKCKNIVLEGTREVTPTVLKESTGLEATKLSLKKWGLSGSSRLVLVGLLGGVSFLLYKEIDIRPNLAAILALTTLDAIFLGGSCLAQISCLWPPYRRRILVHEAGHLLTDKTIMSKWFLKAYLLGCPIRGVILDPIVAMQMGIKGQAGTQFWDENLEKELVEGRLSSTGFDRYCMVLFAGIAAEALVYGEAEGGENDENLFRSLCVILRPPLTIREMSNRARWSVLQSYNLLRWHREAHLAAVKALESGCSLSTVIRRIEEAMPS